MNEKPLLTYPLAHQPITSQLIDLLKDAIKTHEINPDSFPEPTLETAVALLLQFSVEGLAARQGSPAAITDRRFMAGARFASYDMAIEALRFVEERFFTGEDNSYEAFVARGQRVIDEGRESDVDL